MNSFAKWLIEQKSDANADLAALQALAKDPASKWPYWSNRLSDYLAALNAISPTPSQKIKDALEDAHERWLKEDQPAVKKSFWTLIFENLTTVFLGLLVLLFLFAILYGLWNSEFYASLSKTEQGRGLITFVFALTATTVILVVSIGIFAYGNTEDLMKRIIPAKDVLTVVIGVLGTIMGFYFGSATEPRTSAPRTGDLTVSAVDLTPAAVAAGASADVNVTAKISGGETPYIVSIAGRNAAGASAQLLPDKSSGADVSEKVTIPSQAKGAPVRIIVTVKDKKGSSKEGAKDLTIQ